MDLSSGRQQRRLHDGIGSMPSGRTCLGSVSTAAAPALRNAIYAATGFALRRVPIDRKQVAIGVSDGSGV